GEEMTGGRDKASILADGLESLFGAVFLDHGLDISRDIILAIFDDVIGKAGKLGAGLDWKTSLQELSSERELGPPQYQITSTGPDHDKEFTATAVVGGEDLGTGVGRSKKEAEQKAAALAWDVLNNRSGAESEAGEPDTSKSGEEPGTESA
ncbi:MAG: ribonuclease III, partial [Planctomycetes bacterium]|nr:ribonuclease III [Planctomycetota bacterium]